MLVIYMLDQNFKNKNSILRDAIFSIVIMKTKLIKNIFSRIRNIFKRSFDRIRNEKIKLNLLQAIPYWIGSLLTGLIAVMFTKLFVFVEEESSFIFQHAAWAFFIITPLCFIVS